MKCLKCGFVTSESNEVCGRCGSPLPAHAAPLRPSASRPSTPAPGDTPPVPLSSTPVSPVPEWRREVTRKVREYGEKKKVLTTPPQPLKAQPAEGGEPVAAGGEPPEVHAEVLAAQAARSRIVAAALARVEPPAPDLREPAPAIAADPQPAPATVPEPARGAHLGVPESEVFAGDLEDPAPEELEDPLPEEDAPLHLGRRGAALLLDHTMLIVLHAALLYVCAEIISFRFPELLRQAWLPVAGIFLLFHCLYYSYFYKTSRQTPGMVFLGIELRDPRSGGIALRKILIRWLAMAFLNILNLVPLMLGRNELLLDSLSGTRIRTLK